MPAIGPLVISFDKMGPGWEAMKVAQYEVLGNDAKRDVRPGRDDRNLRLLVSRMRLHDRKQPSIVPSGTRRFFERQPSTSPSTSCWASVPDMGSN